MEHTVIPLLNEFSVISNDKVRYCDTDSQGHVNNAIFSTFLETGRVEILYDKTKRIASEKCAFVIASLKLDFLGEIVWPGEIAIGIRISKIGRSSVNIEQGLYQNNKCVALAETVIVQMNEETRKSMALESTTVELLSKFIKK
jgi:acyl-CoA thioester hydrolase